MQIKGMATYARGRPALPQSVRAYSQSFWAAPGSSLGACTQMFAFWNYNLQPNHACMQALEHLLKYLYWRLQRHQHGFSFQNRLKKPSAGMKTDSHILLHTTALPLSHCVSHRSETNNMPDEREDAPGRASRGPSRRQRDSWMLRPGVRMQWRVETLEGEGKTRTIIK